MNMLSLALQWHYCSHMHAILHARIAPLSLYRNSPPWIFHNLISYKALAIIILQLLCFNATFRFPILFMPRFRFPILFMSRFCFPILFMPRSVVSSFPTTLHAIIHHLMHCLPALHHAKQRSLVTATSFSTQQLLPLCVIAVPQPCLDVTQCYRFPTMRIRC